MSKIRRFLVAFDRYGKHEYIIQTISPMFIAELFLARSEAAVLEVEKKMPVTPLGLFFGKTEWNGVTAIIAIHRFIETPEREPDESDADYHARIDRMVHRTVQWYHGILRSDILKGDI